MTTALDHSRGAHARAFVRHPLFVVFVLVAVAAIAFAVVSYLVGGLTPVAWIAGICLFVPIFFGIAIDAQVRSGDGVGGYSGTRPAPAAQPASDRAGTSA